MVQRVFIKPFIMEVMLLFLSPLERDMSLELWMEGRRKKWRLLYQMSP